MIDNLGFTAADKVCLSKEICASDIEFGEASSGSYKFFNDGILGLAMTNSPNYNHFTPTPFNQSVSPFLVAIIDNVVEFLVPFTVYNFPTFFQAFRRKILQKW